METTMEEEAMELGDPARGDSVPLYLDAPPFAIALDEFEDAARGRASLLVLLSMLGERALRGHRGASVHASIRENAFYQQLAAGDSRCDLASHYALRLAFCKTQGADWQWLVDAEAKLLALRLSLRSAQASVTVLSRLGVEYEGERDAESADSHSASDSEDWTGFHSGPRTPTERAPTHYRVPFEHAARLVRRREVEMRRGSCLVPVESMRHVAVHHFEALLRRQMRVLSRSLLTMSSDESTRLGPVLARVVASWQLEVARRGAASGSNGTARARVRLADVDRAAEAHFPLCMRHLHRKLRENHHLKYDGRLQLRMFLKGLGLSVHESVLLFRSEFVKVIPAARFDKEYAYHIRHSYGLEGARKDYAPLDCAQIIHGSAPRHGQFHGCPFKHWDGETLRHELTRRGLSIQTSSQVAGEAASGRYRSACRMLFDATHRYPYAQAMGSAQYSTALSESLHGSQVQHPNAYVDASVAVASDRGVQRGQAEK